LTQFVSPDDEHDVLETCREFKIKIRIVRHVGHLLRIFAVFVGHLVGIISVFVFVFRRQLSPLFYQTNMMNILLILSVASSLYISFARFTLELPDVALMRVF
jgi:hypothetical protein